jgi:hypothetical protein
VDGRLNQVPSDPVARKKWLASARERKIRPAIAQALAKWYGPQRAGKASAAEAFEVCEYGSQPNDDQIRRLFPMLK